MPTPDKKCQLFHMHPNFRPQVVEYPDGPIFTLYTVYGRNKKQEK